MLTFQTNYRLVTRRGALDARASHSRAIFLCLFSRKIGLLPPPPSSRAGYGPELLMLFSGKFSIEDGFQLLQASAAQILFTFTYLTHWKQFFTSEEQKDIRLKTCYLLILLVCDPEFACMYVNSTVHSKSRPSVLGVVNVLSTTPLWVANTRLKLQSHPKNKGLLGRPMYKGMIGTTCTLVTALLS